VVIPGKVVEVMAHEMRDHGSVGRHTDAAARPACRNATGTTASKRVRASWPLSPPSSHWYSSPFDVIGEGFQVADPKRRQQPLTQVWFNMHRQAECLGERRTVSIARL
jgi:hypothetical protein